MKQHGRTVVALPSPLSLFLTVLGIVFLAEFVVMVLFGGLLSARYSFLGNLLDSVLLIIFTAPFLWRLVVRPLRSAALAEHARAATVLACAVDGIITISAQVEDRLLHGPQPAMARGKS